MGFDPFSPISPARLNVLLVPAGRVQADRFDRLVSHLLEYDVVSLGDIVADERIAKRPGLFSPTVFAAGRVLLKYGTSAHTQGIDSFPFELNRSPQIVIAIAEEHGSISAITSNGAGEVPMDDQGWENTFDDLLRSFQESIHQEQRPLLRFLAIFEEDSAGSFGRKLTWCSSTGERHTSDTAHFVSSILASMLDVFDNILKDYKDVMIKSPHLTAHERTNSTSHNSNAAFLQSSRLPVDSSHALAIANGVESGFDTISSDTSRSGGGNGSGFANPKIATSSDSLYDSSRARYQILLGTLYLQAGRWPDSLRELSEGAVATRGFMLDTLWHAHALECMLVCMIMFAWAQLDFNIPQICFASIGRNQEGRWASLTSQVNGTASAESPTTSLHSLAKLAPGLFNAIIALHTNVSSTAQEQLPVVMLAELKIRQADLLATICLQGGTLTKPALDHLVTDATLPSAGSVQLGPPAVSLQRHTIARLLTDAVEELPSNFPPRSSIDILVVVSLRLSKLGMDRLQAYCLKILLQKLIPGLIDARKIGAAELGIHPAAALSLQGGAGNGTSTNARLGIETVLDTACEAYGLPRALDSNEQAEFDSSPLASVRRNVSQWSEAYASGDLMIKLGLLRICANVCEALPDLESGLRYTTQLLRFARRSLCVSSNLEHDVPHISQDEQMRLLNNIKRTVTAANKLGMPSLRAWYWDDFLVRGIELLDSHESDRLTPHTPQELSLTSGAAKDAKKDPFIYNPLAKYQKSNEGASVLVVGEIAYFCVVLQNPFEFDVEVDSISIFTQGAAFEASSHNIVLGHCCCQRFILSGIPRAEGALRVIGCKARIKDCYEQQFWVLPQPSLTSRIIKQRRKASAYTSSAEDSQSPNGVLGGKGIATGSPDADLFPTTLAVDVIREQPKISIEHTSLSLSSLMLLEGEKRRLEVTLKNNAVTASADLIFFTFDDSVTRQMQEASANKALSSLELYELQLQLLERPALKWLSDEHPEERPSIKPGQSHCFAFEIIGIAGLMDATIQVDCANLGRPRSEVNEKFYTRQLQLPISVTVNGSIEIPRCNILPFFNVKSQMKPTFTDAKAENQSTDLNSECLVLLDFRNIWPSPITVAVRNSSDAAPQEWAGPAWSGERGTTETLQPGHVSRIVLIMPRVIVADPHAPIPTIGTQRQFVVSTSKVSMEVEIASREAFWYREELLRRIGGTWTEQETGRYGVIDIRRGIRLSARMIEALKIDSVDIRFAVPSMSRSPAGEDADRPLPVAGTFMLPVGVFTRIGVKIHNRSQKKLHLLLRLQPSLHDQLHNVALDLSKRLAWSGLLQRPLHPALEPGEVRKEELGITALVSGHFEISATVEEIKASKAGRSLDGVEAMSAGAERRIWHGREQCLIHAVESSPD